MRMWVINADCFCQQPQIEFLPLLMGNGGQVQQQAATYLLDAYSTSHSSLVSSS